MQIVDWVPSDGIILEDNADLAIRSDRNILLTAGPGAGKTELLAQKANFLFTTGKCNSPFKILALSFKNDSASNLGKRVNSRTANQYKNRLDSSTYDSFFKMILDHFLGALPPQIRPSYDYTINNDDLIKDALHKVGLTWKYNYQFYTYLHDLEYIDLSDKEAYIRPLWDYLFGKSILTYGMIRALVRWIVINKPKIRLAIQKTYTFVFLDEFQDTTPIQYEIVKSLFRNTKTKITAVGDVKQRIMLWAGAMKDVFSKFISDFAAEEIILTANHRSAKSLIDLQNALYSLVDKNLPCSCDLDEGLNNKQGKISLLHTSTTKEEAKKVAEIIREKLNAGINESDICILVRAHLPEYSCCVINELSKLGIRSRIEEAYQEMLSDPVINLILSMLMLSLDDSVPTLWVELVQEIRSLKSIDSDNTLDVMRLSQSIELELEVIKDKFTQWMGKQSFINMMFSILEFIGIGNITAKYRRYNSPQMITELITEFSNLFYSELNDSFWELDKAIESFQGKDTVKIMTIHKSKGLEFNTVILLGLEDDAFFNIKKNPEEEISTIYVAISRAKEEIVFTWCDFRDYKADWRHDGTQSINHLRPIYEVLLGTPGLIVIEP